MSYDKIICKSPADFNLQELYGSSISVPVGISFEDEEFEPWTESTHRFRYYDPPKLVRADPDEIEVGKMAEVYIFADDNSEFWERKNKYFSSSYSNAKWWIDFNRSLWN